MREPLIHFLPISSVALTAAWLCGLWVDRLCEHPWRALNVFVTAMILAMGVWAYTTVPPQLLMITFGLGCALVVLAATDLSTMRLPDIVTIPLLLGGLLLRLKAIEPSLVDRLAGALIGYAIFVVVRALYRKARSRDGLGLGDAKLAAEAGPWLG